MLLVTPTETNAKPRVPLTKERVLLAAVAYADEHGIESLSMRNLGQELGVEAMSLYNHVANKEDILDGMVDAVVSEIPLETAGPDWKTILRCQILAARAVMARHQWAPSVIETRTQMSTPMMKYFDAVGGIFLDSGFTVDLLHHGMHALGSRALGFVQELYDDSQALDESPEVMAVMMQQMTAEYPNISKIVKELFHEEDSIIGTGCDSDFEFVFSVDLILDGLERVRDAAPASEALQKV
jgi:AcrR family transcriptional regulator